MTDIPSSPEVSAVRRKRCAIVHSFLGARTAEYIKNIEERSETFGC